MADAFAVTDPFTIEADQWQQLSATRPALRTELLQEYAAMPGSRLRLFTQADHSGLTCGAVAELTVGEDADGRLEGILFGRARRLATRLRLGGRPYLCIGAPLGQDSGVVLRNGPPEQRRHWLSAFLAQLEGWADAQGMGLLFISVPDTEQPLRELLWRRGYLGSQGRSGTVLPIAWRSFEEYHALLTRRGGRIGATVRQERRRSERAGVVIRRAEPSAASAQTLYRLALDHYRYKNGEPPPYTAEYLQRLLPRLGEDVLVLEAIRGDVCCAMAAVVRSGQAGWVAFFGLDTRDRPNDFTYFNILFYSLADHAANFGLQHVFMGNGAYAAKLRRGCQLQPVEFFVRPHARWRRWLLAPCVVLHRRLIARKFV